MQAKYIALPASLPSGLNNIYRIESDLQSTTIVTTNKQMFSVQVFNTVIQ